MLAAHRMLPAATLALIVAVALMGCGKGSESKRLTGVDAQLAEYLGPPEGVRLKFQERGTYRRIRPETYRQRIEDPLRPGRVGIGHPLNASDKPGNVTRKKYKETFDYFELWVENGKLWRSDVVEDVLIDGPLAVNAKTWPLDPRTGTRPDPTPGTDGPDCTITAMGPMTVLDRELDTLEVTCISTTLTPDRVNRGVRVFAKGYGIIRDSYGSTRPTALDRYDMDVPDADLVLVDIQPLSDGAGSGAAP